jgi:hypothetical protein
VGAGAAYAGAYDGGDDCQRTAAWVTDPPTRTDMFAEASAFVRGSVTRPLTTASVRGVWAPARRQGECYLRIGR